MANFVHLLIGVVSALTFISFININSLPTDVTLVVNASIVEPTVEKHHPECTTDVDCNNHGRCLNDSKCHCDRGWTTHGTVNDTKAYCTYEQCSQKKTFFISFFTGAFGVDWFYLSRNNWGYIIAGVFKLLLSVGCCTSWSITYFRPELQNSESIKIKLRGVSTCFSLLAFVWWIVDWARVLGNRFPDGRGVGLTPW